MRALRRRLRACAAPAVLAIFALAMGPTVSRLCLQPVGPASPAHHEHQAHAGDAGMAVAMAAPSDERKTPVPAHQHALEHCALCVLGAHAFTLSQEAPTLVAFVGCTHPTPAQIVAAPLRLRVDWNPASSRGPPLVA